MTEDTQKASAVRLGRMLRPSSVAVIGASEKHHRARAVVTGLRELGVDLYLINPNRQSVFGLQTFPSLAAVCKPIDAVFVTVNANAAIEAVAAGVEVDIGGFVVNAGGFGESGEGGADRQQKLVDAARGRAILGPNCNGFIDVNRGLRISAAPHLPIRKGGVAFVTHSGALFASMGAAGYMRNIGFSYLISTGNEAATDMADCIEFLVEDPQTKVICLAVETIRHPQNFFAAVARAEKACKPVLAIKLGRSERSKAIASSHTGALAGETWIYDAAFRQHGIEIAHDLTELADRAICFEQMPPSRWSPVKGLAILTASGGGAEMASDYCARMNISLPVLNSLKADVQEIVPGTKVLNPLDMTGFVLGDAERARKLFNLCVGSDEVDSILVQWFLHDEGVEHGAAMLDALKAVSGMTDKFLMLGSLEDCEPGTWAQALGQDGIAITRGLPSTLRSLQSMGAFVRRQQRIAKEAAPVAVDRIPRPAEIVHSSIGHMVEFGAAMRLLSDAGFAVAPFKVVAGDSIGAKDVGFDGPYVVKLADIPHRTELGAVRLNVKADDLGSAVRDMRGIALANSVSSSVVIQKQLRLTGEAFIGIKKDPTFGPVIMCGAGGILVELMRRMVGGVAPLSPMDVDWMLDELAALGVSKSVRGSEPWDRTALGSVLEAASRFATGSSAWLDTLDINPLGVCDGRFVVLDALLTTESTSQSTAGPRKNESLEIA